MSDTISREAVLDKFQKICDSCGEYEKHNGVMCGTCYLDGAISIVEDMPSAQQEPAIPLQWIEAQIEWLKSLDNGFSTLTAVQISAMVNKWKDKQDG